MAKPPSEERAHRGKLEQESVTLSFKIDEANIPSATFSNFIAASRVGPEIQLDFYQVDLQNLVRVIQAAKERGAPAEHEVPAAVKSRIVLGAGTFMRAWPVLSEMHSDLMRELSHGKEGK